MIADGHPKNVSRQVLHRDAAIPDRLGVHDPVWLPNGARDRVKEVCFLPGGTELGAKNLTQGFDWQQESTFA